MFNLSDSHTYHLYSQPTDMRKSFDSLAGLVRNEGQGDPFNGEVYIFMNKQRNRVKLLHWETGGFTLYYKRLEKGQFELPSCSSSHCMIQWSDLMLIMEGIGLKNLKRRERFSFNRRLLADDS